MRKLAVWFFTVVIILSVTACSGMSGSPATEYDEAGYEKNGEVYDISIGEYAAIASESTFSVDMAMERGFLQQGESQPVVIGLSEGCKLEDVRLAIVSAVKKHKSSDMEDAVKVYVGNDLEMADENAYYFELTTEGMEPGIYDIRLFDVSGENALEIGFVSFKVTETNEVIQKIDAAFDEQWNAAQEGIKQDGTQ